MASSEQYRQYVIPENVTDGGYIKGFRKRNAIEGGILAAIGFILLLPLHLAGTSRISTTIFVSGPLFLVGAIGVEGDPLSVFVKNSVMWLKNRSPMLFNNTPRILEESPVDSALEASDMKAAFFDKLDAVRTKMQTSGLGDNMVEGEDFEFVADRDEIGFLAEQMEQYQDDGELLDGEFFVVAPEVQADTEPPAKPAVKAPTLKPRADLSALKMEDLF